MLVVKKRFGFDFYRVEVNLNKLKEINKQIKKDCSYIYEKQLIMPTKISYNPDLIVLSSLELKERNDFYGTINVYDNLCRIRKYPLVCEYIDMFLQTNNNDLIVNIFDTMLEDVIINEEDVSYIETPTKSVVQYTKSLRSCFKFEKIKSVKSNVNQFDCIPKEKVKFLELK